MDISTQFHCAFRRLLTPLLSILTFDQPNNHIKTPFSIIYQHLICQPIIFKNLFSISVCCQLIMFKSAFGFNLFANFIMMQLLCITTSKHNYHSYTPINEDAVLTLYALFKFMQKLLSKTFACLQTIGIKSISGKDN